MNERRRTVAWAVAAVTAITTAGSLWYWLVEGFSLLDGIYQSIVTVSTVGFGEIRPLDTSGRIFTIVLIVLGVGAIGFALAGMVEALFESALNRVARRRKERTLDSLSGHTLVCGFGSTGRAVLDLLPRSTPVGVIERDPGCCTDAEAAGAVVIEGDCTDEETLRRAGIERAAVLIVCLTQDSDAISTVLSATDLNPDLQVSTRVNDVSSRHKLHLAGAQHVASPVDMAAQRLVADVLHPQLASFLEAAVHDDSVDLAIRAVKVGPSSPLVGTDLTSVAGACGVRIIGRQDRDGRIGRDDDAPLHEGATVFVAGSAGELDTFAAAAAG